MNPTKPDAPDRKGHDAYLDCLRGLAALTVFLTHVRGGFFAKWGDLDAISQGPLNYSLFLFTRLGREAVILFFILSGYLVGGQALLALRQGRYSPSGYFVARASRLYTVVVPALLLTGAVDYLAGTWTSTRDGVEPFLINLLFLQQIFGDSYGSNAVFWSLSYECWFYVLFGLALTIGARFSRWTSATTIVLLIASLLMLGIRCPQILLMLPLWLAGVLVRSMPAFATGKRFTIPASFALLCGALIVSSTRWDWLGDFAVGLAAATFLYFLRSARPPRGAWRAAATGLAGFSFSLYAVHYPLTKLVFTKLVDGRRTHAGPREWLEWLTIVVCEAAVCWIFYWLFERRTPVVRRALLWLSAVVAQQSREYRTRVSSDLRRRLFAP